MVIEVGEPNSWPQSSQPQSCQSYTPSSNGDGDNGGSSGGSNGGSNGGSSGGSNGGNGGSVVDNTQTKSIGSTVELFLPLFISMLIASFY